ncbi:hypothetical protein ACFWD7_03145 [Streptomyces mirabilis]|uniref:hypothetical protein n=1 Tax=Streptomyces mirabilis TaxID=68239 RepID=UPI0021C22164|nr:hypothetical protein [Streptomyces mirabilis]MCT9106914.1 hypothetical protein [Streptomyces mirabilis]
MGLTSVPVRRSLAPAALIYQHMTNDRDRAIADRLGAMIRDGGGDPSGKVDKDSTRTQWHACGTAPETVKGRPGR